MPAILMDVADNRLFISCTSDNHVSIIDLGSLEVSGRLEIGGRPDGLAFAGGE
jgi:hypothetical protein